MNTDSRLWGRIPAELRAREQWCLAGPEKAPRTVIGAYASVTDPSTWDNFGHVAEAAHRFGCAIGYVLSPLDPFTCIDLDVVDEESQRRKGQKIDPSKWTTQEDFDRYWRAIHFFCSYTERSVNGKGVHIWVRGKFGRGRKRDGIEVYSQERFIVCTGDVLGFTEIVQHQETLTKMAHDMRPDDDIQMAPDEPPQWTDYEVWTRLRDQTNGHRFSALWDGLWGGRYPSQSEADDALLTMLCFKSRNNEQVRRMFRLSALGQRPKAKRDDYLNRTIARERRKQGAADAEWRAQRALTYAVLPEGKTT